MVSWEAKYIREGVKLRVALHNSWLKTLTEPPFCYSTPTHDNPPEALSGHPQALNWSGELTWTAGGTAIIDGEKGESTYSGLKEPDSE